jgi:hypothetical protein
LDDKIKEKEHLIYRSLRGGSGSFSGEEESASKKSAEKAEATAKVNAQLTQLRSKLKTLHDRKAR